MVNKSMFGLIKPKNSCEQDAAPLYAVLLERSCQRVFYEDYGVADSFEGRFDMLLLHVFIAMHVVLDGENGHAFNQNLFDAMFADMDQALREGGKGDMGVPKQMRAMMKAFNGRMNRYNESLSSNQAFEQALAQNLYGDAEPPKGALRALACYVQDNIEHLKEGGADALKAGEISLIKVKVLK